jgi:predicted NUDIX family phosphoesterase
MPLDEHVLCIPASHFRTVGAFEGFRPADEAYRTALLDAAQYRFLPRSEVETDPSWLQLIPYVVLVCGAQVFHYRRGASGTEARLRALRSVGIGGHISEADAAGGSDPYATGMAREVFEEVTHAAVVSERLLGFIHDPRTLVGSVHLGVVHLWELAEAKATPKEDALADCGFAPMSELIRDKEQFETWSQFVLEVLSLPDR